MAFKTVSALDADTTISLGGMNKKTGKKNPTQVEGYYLGKKEVDSPKAKTGKAYLYIFQTSAGNVGVWGKTNLDRKMSQAVVGQMTRVSQSGTQETKNGPMYLYSVTQDDENTIEVANESVTNNSSEELLSEADTPEYGKSSVNFTLT